MTPEVQQHINRFYYNLSMENLADADKDLKAALEHKVNQILDEEYEKVKKCFEKNK